MRRFNFPLIMLLLIFMCACSIIGFQIADYGTCGSRALEKGYITGEWYWSPFAGCTVIIDGKAQSVEDAPSRWEIQPPSNSGQ